MKERIEAENNLKDSVYRKALTPEQLLVPRCRWFHRWARVDNPLEYNGYQYFQCKKCYDRKAVERYFRKCSSPPDWPWLRGKSWKWIPPVPTTLRPCSAVPPLKVEDPSYSVLLGYGFKKKKKYLEEDK